MSDNNDERPPQTLGDIIIDAIIQTDAIHSAYCENGATIFCWNANAAEQIEAAVAGRLTITNP